jgi:hypothetical protein
MAVRIWLRAVVAAIALACAAPSLAQTMGEDAFVALMHRLATDTTQLRDSIRLMYGTLPPEHEEEMVRYAVYLYTNDDLLDFYYRNLQPYLIEGIDPGYLFGVTAAVSQAAISYGSIRLPTEQQEMLFAFNAAIAEWLLGEDPALCVRFWVTGDLSAADLSLLEFRFYESMPIEDLVALHDLYREAMLAMVRETPPAQPFTDAQLTAGAQAYQAAVNAVYEASPFLPQIAANQLDMIPAGALCSLGLAAFHAYRNLEQPTRAWAVQATLRARIAQSAAPL